MEIKSGATLHPSFIDGLSCFAKQTGQRHGPIAQEEAEFPKVWKARRGSRPDPLEETGEGDAAVLPRDKAIL